MGFRVRPKTYRLKFDGEEFDGLEIDIRSMTIREWERMMAPAADLPDGPDASFAEREAARKAAVARSDENLALFAARVVRWNLEDDDGNPLPVTLEAVKGLERSFVAELITAWQLALLGVDPTSGSGSSNGARPPEMPQQPITAEDLMTESLGRSGQTM